DLDPAIAVRRDQVVRDQLLVLVARQSFTHLASPLVWVPPAAARRCCEIATASSQMSEPMKCLAWRSAATPAEPDPQNGSITNSPGVLLCCTSTSASSAGFSVGYPRKILGKLKMSGVARFVNLRLPFSKNSTNS